MRKLWLLAGRIAYWLSWPITFIALYSSNRTRILVIYDNQILTVQGWLGDGKWHLPGGGLHRGEKPAIGALRELQEEVGIRAEPDQLKPLFNKRVRSSKYFRYFCHAYALELTAMPELRLQRIEITKSMWQSFDNIRQSRAGNVAAEMLAVWEQKSQNVVE